MKDSLFLLISFCFCFCFYGLKAQTIHQSINASGGNISGANGKISYSVGQVFYTVKGGHNGTASEGVQQPYEISVITETIETEGINLSATIYPNPASEILMLNIGNYEVSDLFFQMYDITGKLLEERKITDIETTIDMSNKAKAIYFLRLFTQKQEIKSFRIIKN